MKGRIVLFVLVALFAGVSWVLSFEASRLQDLTERVGVLDPRTFERLTLITAGTGAAQEDPERLGPILVVGAGQHAVAIDAGRATGEALRRAKLPLTQVDTVLLTSLLPENVVGIPELLLAGWAASRSTPLRLVGPPGTKALAAGIEQAYAGPIAAAAAALGLSPDAAHIEALEIGDGWHEEKNGLTLRAAALPEGPFPALAYRFESGGRAIVVSGVGFGRDALVALAKAADVLVSEAMHTPTIERATTEQAPEAERIAKEAALHTHAAASGEVARRAGVRELVLVRLRPPPLHDRQYTGLVRESFSGPVVVAEDAAEFTR